MNHNIRYQQPYLSTNTYKLPPNRTIQPTQMSSHYHRQPNNDNQTQSQFRKLSQDQNERNSRQKSVNNNQRKEYINGGGSVLLPMSYKLQCSNMTGNMSQQQASHYRTTHNFYKSSEINHTESANDFFNQVASQISQQPKMQKVISQTYNQPPTPQPISQPVYVQQQLRKAITTDKSTSQKDCDRCLQLQCQLQKVFKFMREQLEIGAKQYSDRMNKIVTEQAREIMDLRKLLVNNQKGIIKINKAQSTSSYQSNKKLSPSQSQLKSKSPTKISLTKSSSSISANNSHRQKITMVSKQLSPNKSYNKTVQNIAGSSSTTIEQLSQKIRILQQKLQIGLKITNETNQKIYVMNKKIQVLEKGVINVLGAKVQRAKESLKVWMKQQQERQHNLYKQMKLISSRLSNFCSNQHQPLSPLLMNSQNTHSSPLIPHFQQCQSTQLSNPKLLIRLKKYSSQLQDLRQLLTNLQTKQFKYDNYQINTLAQYIHQIRQKVLHLEKVKHHISHKLVQTQHKLIQQSKYSNLTQSISKHQYVSNQPQNQQTNVKRVNMARKNSVQLTYSHNNINNSYQQSLNQIGTKSMRVYQYPQSYYQGSKVTKCTKLTSGNQSHSQSQYKGLLCGQASQYSQYMTESAINTNNTNHYTHQQSNNNNQQQEYNQQEQFEESFNSDSYDEKQQQEEEDEFFYAVDLERQEVNGLRVSASDRRMGGNHVVGRNDDRDDYEEQQQQGYQYPSGNVHRFMQVIQCRRQIPLKIQIDQTGYIKSAQNGMYIVDRNMDAFDLSKAELEWLKKRGIIIIEH